MLLELLFAATLSGQDVYTQEECLHRYEEEGVVEPWDAAGCLVSWIYSAETHAALDPFGRDMETVFSRDAIAAIEAARARWPGDGLTPGLDADPFCECQDPEGLFLILQITREESPTRVTSGVAFAFKPEDVTEEEFVQLLIGENAPPVTQRLVILVLEDRGWRVDDISDGEGYFFRASLALPADSTPAP